MPMPEGLKNFSKSKPIKSEYFEEAKKLWEKKELTRAIVDCASRGNYQKQLQS